MFYLTTTKYVGPNRDTDDYCDADVIEISTSPAVKNLSNEVCIDGWCGTTNNWSLTAHGEYETIDAARAAITELFGDVREMVADDYKNAVVDAYLFGKYERLSSQATANWIYDSMRDDVTADTTNDQIAVLAAEYEGYANSDGYTLSGADCTIEEFRDDLRADRDAEQGDE